MSLTSLERARPKGVTSCPACFSGGKKILYSVLWSQFWPASVWRVSPDSWLKGRIIFCFENSDHEVLWAFSDWESQVLQLFSHWKSGAQLSLVPRFFLKVRGRGIFAPRSSRCIQCLSGRKLFLNTSHLGYSWLLNAVLIGISSCQLLARNEFCNLRERSILCLGKYL